MYEGYIKAVKYYPYSLTFSFYSEPPPKQRKGNEKVKHIDITSTSTHITPKYFFIHRRIKEKKYDE